LLPQRSKHPREIVITPKASTSIFGFLRKSPGERRFLKANLAVAVAPQLGLVLLPRHLGAQVDHGLVGRARHQPRPRRSSSDLLVILLEIANGGE